jgi:hypothetical protein
MILAYKTNESSIESAKIMHVIVYKFNYKFSSREVLFFYFFLYIN